MSNTDGRGGPECRSGTPGTEEASLFDRMESVLILHAGAIAVFIRPIVVDDAPTHLGIR